MSTVRFCFIGHVDAGKSSTAGHLLVNCGYFNDHELNKNGLIKDQTIKEDDSKKINKRQLYSNLLDIYEEERTRGKTHEYSTISFTHKDRQFELIDTPGHKSFLRELIAGLSSINSNELIGCLLISVSKGEFDAGWNGGQTKEDIILTRAIGVKYLIVLLNKMDTLNWDENKILNVKETVGKFLKSCRFKEFIFLPVSAYEGEGLTERKYLTKYPTLIDTLINYNDLIVSEIKDKDDSKEFKLPIGYTISKIVVTLKILQCSGLVTSGYSGVAHFQGSESEFIIERLLKKKFLKNNESGQCIISLQPVKIKYDTSSIIFRSGNLTIGYGRIEKILYTNDKVKC